MQGLIDAARAAHVMIATAESCTGGMVSAAITNDHFTIIKARNIWWVQ